MVDFRIPLFISPRLGSVSTPIDELFERFNNYGQALNHATRGEIKKLFILGNIPPSRATEKYEFVHYSYIGKTPFFQIFQTVAFLKKFPRKKFCLIAGDLWLGGIEAQLIKIFYSKNSKTQISIHGFPNFSSNSFVKFLKISLFRILINSVGSIRVVSKSILSLLSKYTDVTKRPIVLAPIPLNVSQNLVEAVRTTDIVTVGRLHPERGVTDSLKILEQILNESKTHSIQIIGDGPLFNDVLIWKNSLNDSGSVKLFGSIPNSEVKDKLSKARLLLSCAAEEGYGMALREALMQGAYVVAQKNSGTDELNRLYPESVFLFNSKNEAVHLITKILQSERNFVDTEKIREKQVLINRESLNILIESWIE